MKTLFFTMLAFTLAFVSCRKNTGTTGVLPSPVIANGTYAIINVATQKALTPVQLVTGQNVFLQDQEATNLLQRWTINFDGQYYTLSTKNNSSLYFQPFPGGDHTAIIGNNDGNSNPKFILEKLIEGGPEYFIIKSVLLGQNALYHFPNGAYVEAKFMAYANTDSFKWQFVKY